MSKADKAASEARRLADRIVLRHRGEGHLRFQLPTELCGPGAAAALEERLRAVEGIYRVTVYSGAGKLSVRYMETVLGWREVARALFQALVKLPKEASAEESASLLSRIKSSSPWQSMRHRIDDWKKKARVASAVISAHSGMPVKVPPDIEKAAFGFFNDLVAFYLIKVHWNMITQQWLKQPLQYRYAWLTVTYLVFLMVRHRKAGQKPKAKK